MGVPRKNLRPVGGVPLIAHAVEVAGACPLISRTIVSTEDEGIASVARAYGGDVPFRRPARLATATARVFDVILHAAATLKSLGDGPYDDIVLLEPTCPLRIAADIETCIRTLWSSAADSVITVYRHPQIHPRIMYTIDRDATATLLWNSEDRMLQRQELEPVFIRSGVVYAFRAGLVLKGRDIYGKRTVAVEIPYERSFGIDDAVDLAICESILSRGSRNGVQAAGGR